MTGHSGLYVVRPERHSRGQNFEVETGYELARRLGQPGWYARPLINKAAEYRVYTLFGRVAAVAQKARPSDADQHAWNHALGCSFSNVRWSCWPVDVLAVAVKAAKLSGLHFAAVDVMVEEGTLTPYIIEINSAGSLPRNADRSPSYRARCVANVLAYHLHNEDYGDIDCGQGDTWKDYIHPGVKSPTNT